MWLDHSFLRIGAFVNVTTGTLTAFGGDIGRLRPFQNAGYAQYQVYHGFRQDWVYETGVIYSGGTPTVASGVYINGTFYNTDTATGIYAHRIEYPAGRVVFSGALPSTSVVRCNYSYRLVQVSNAEIDTSTRFHFDSLKGDDPHFSQYGSGLYNQPYEQRIQMPRIVIEVPNTTSSRPYQLGSLQQWKKKEVHFNIFAESDSMRKQLTDILELQNDKSIYLIDLYATLQNNDFPLTVYGTVNDNGLMYPNLVNVAPDGYRYKQVRFTDTNVINMGQSHPKLYSAVVTTNMEYVLP